MRARLILKNRPLLLAEIMRKIQYSSEAWSLSFGPAYSVHSYLFTISYLTFCLIILPTNLVWLAGWGGRGSSVQFRGPLHLWTVTIRMCMYHWHVSEWFLHSCVWVLPASWPGPGQPVFLWGLLHGNHLHFLHLCQRGQPNRGEVRHTFGLKARSFWTQGAGSAYFFFYFVWRKCFVSTWNLFCFWLQYLEWPPK